MNARDDLARLIKDAYYHARDHGGTMHTAADDAADAIIAAGWVPPERFDYEHCLRRQAESDHALYVKTEGIEPLWLSACADRDALAAVVARVEALCDNPTGAAVVLLCDLRAALHPDGDE